MRRVARRRIAVVGAVLTAAAGLSGSPWAGADGDLRSGNQNCSDLIEGALELRVNSPADGTFSTNGFSLTMDVRTLTSDDSAHPGDQTGSQVFDFEDVTGGVVIGVAVKGGPDTNFYDYRPDGTTSEDGLHAPVNPSNQRFYGLSHVSFCYLPVVPDTIQLKKVDEAGAPLAGAVMQLWRETNNTMGLQTTGLTPDTQVNGNCTTTGDGIGNCIFSISTNGTYYGLELTAPPGYSCCAPVQSTVVTLDATADTIVLSFTDSPAEGNVRVVKTDDSGALMSGVTFRLTGTSNLGTVVNVTCTTDNLGVCTFSNIELGTYSLDEDSGIPSTHEADPTLPKTVVIDEDGETVSVSVENPRLHKVIVLVCHEGTNTLTAATVQNGTGTKTSIDSAPTGLTDAQLCSLGGATWGGFGHDDTKTTTAQFGTTTHP